MIKPLLISIMLVMSVLLYGLTQWLAQEEIKIEQINRQHNDEIRRLHKIAQINKWLDDIIKPTIEKIPHDEVSLDDSLVIFFDTYAEEFDFRVHRYIHVNDFSHDLQIDFQLSRETEQKLSELMQLRYKRGFLQFQSFEMDDKIIKGTLEVIQPYYGEHNVSLN